MTSVLPRGRSLVGLAFVAAAVVVLLVAVAPRGSSSGSGGVQAMSGASQQFLSKYVAADGRVVRRDQGGDVVSEGQAYAMLISAALGDRATFGKVWRWTRTHLQRRDQLLSSLWRGGAVADRHPAADADVDAAHALIMAGRRFEDPGLDSAGRRIAAAILARETVSTTLGPVLAAGPWAVRQRIVNPSYFSPSAFRELARATGDPRWDYLEFTSYRVVDRLTSSSSTVPPDWATVDDAGNPSPRGTQPGREPRFGFEAFRIPIRMAASGTAYGRGLASRIWHFFSTLNPQSVVPRYTLGGAPRAHSQHATMLAAAAAAGAASGETDRSQAFMVQATSVDRASPTYYGSAWLALTNLVIDGGLAGGPV
jgi:endoglucanase